MLIAICGLTPAIMLIGFGILRLLGWPFPNRKLAAVKPVGRKPLIL